MRFVLREVSFNGNYVLHYLRDLYNIYHIDFSFSFSDMMHNKVVAYFGTCSGTVVTLFVTQFVTQFATQFLSWVVHTRT